MVRIYVVDSPGLILQEKQCTSHQVIFGGQTRPDHHKDVRIIMYHNSFYDVEYLREIGIIKELRNITKKG